MVSIASMAMPARRCRGICSAPEKLPKSAGGTLRLELIADGLRARGLGVERERLLAAPLFRYAGLHELLRADPLPLAGLLGHLRCPLTLGRAGGGRQIAGVRVVCRGGGSSCRGCS